MPERRRPDTPATISATGEFTVDTRDAQTVNIDELRAQHQPDGKHFWTVSLHYYLTDPETALDNMDLGMHNLIGAGAIGCWWCKRKYVDAATPGPVCAP